MIKTNKVTHLTIKMFSDGSILIICQLVSHFLATNAIKIPHSALPKSSEKALLGYQINTFNLL